ncbi:MAG: FlgD immunoglobulin-like domain containing protein [Bacteroidales bacterium]
MAKKIITGIYLILGLISVIKAEIITVKQDGSGDFTTIQAGINAASPNSGDTVLVWPGIYYEHIYFNGKHITLTGLYVSNQDPWFIHNTIIDGSNNVNCVMMSGGSDTMVINGFTIRNGSSTTGGGIYTNQATVAIKNCIIENNYALAGGGVYLKDTQGFLSGTTIRYNYGAWGGGGIAIMFDSFITFDTMSKCNIYMNYAPNGSDIAKNPSAPDQAIYLDTLTVFNPDYHFVSSSDDYLYPQNDIELHIDHAYLQPVDHDLYVNPVSGDDNNSGTSPDDPLKTIAFAIMLIKSDSLNPHNIYLANGIYSLSTNGEKLTMGTRSYISLIGDNPDSTIIDGENTFWIMRGLGLMREYSIENITFQHGREGIYFERNDNVTIKNVTVRDGGNEVSAGLTMGNVDSINLKKIVLTNLVTTGVLVCVNGDPQVRSFKMEDIIADYNFPGNNPLQSGMTGGGVGIGGNHFYPTTYSYYGTVTNLKVTNNLQIIDPMWGTGGSIAFGTDNNSKTNLVNSTIGYNTIRVETGSAVGVVAGSELNIYNSIFYGDSLLELSLGHPQIYNDPSICRVYYSNIEGGEENVKNWNGINTLVWGPGNIDSDPLWDTTAAIPYALPWNSPCVNTGTPMYEFGMSPPYIIQEDTLFKLITFDYDTIVLPQTDLAGNPRIVGGRIDMGAYECQDTTTGITNTKNQISRLKVEAYPNPFYANTSISFQLNEKTDLQTIIYDLKGNEVKRLMDASLPSGKYNLTWAGDDNSGVKVENGIYLVTVYSKGIKQTSEKIIKNSLR